MNLPIQLQKRTMKMQNLLAIKKPILFVLLLFAFKTLFSQDIEPKENAFRFIAGLGPMNLSEFQCTGIAINNSFEFELKKWFFVSANVHLGHSGNNNTDYTYFKYYPDFPENIETNFYETNTTGTTMNSFSSAGVFALINPTVNSKTRIVFGPGVCFVSWKEMSTNYNKYFREYEFYEATNRIANSKKIDLGIRISLERDIANKIFAGLIFQGYAGKENASTFSIVAGFKLF